jgi:RecJ-like exonuclease
MIRISSLACAAVLGLASLAASADDAKQKTVAAVHQEKSALSGQTVRVQGKVVKVNNGIMGRNFLHVQDGTGDASSNDLTVTSKDTAKVGDQVTVTGKVTLGRDFGSGYTYPLLVEEAVVAPAK